MKTDRPRKVDSTASFSKRESLEARIKKLAADKSHLQLIVNLMDRLTSASGFDNTVQSLLQSICESIGGVNIALYCVIEGSVLYADAIGNKKRLDEIDDPEVKGVFDTRQPVEIRHGGQDTQMVGPEFENAFTWIVPLAVGSELVAVLKLESLHVAMDELSEQLPTFFSYAALVLKNEILGQTRIQRAYAKLQMEVAVRVQAEEALRVANEELEERVSDRTAELRAANEQLQEDEARIRRLLDVSERSRLALVNALKQEESARQELRSSADEIQDLYDHAPCGYHSLDKDGVFVRINETELAWLGYDREEILGKKRFSDLLTAQGKTVFLREFAEFLETGRVHDVEFDLISKNGEVMPVAISATAVKDAAGRFLMSRSIMHDITYRRQAEIERQHRARFVESLDRVSLAIQRSSDLDQMMGNVLDVLLDVLDCERTFLSRSAEQGALETAKERTRPDQPVLDPAQRLAPIDLRFDSVGPVQYGSADAVGYRSGMALGLHPQTEEAWFLGVHRCSSGAKWTAFEESLFQEIGNRVADALTSFTSRRDLEVSEYRLEEAERIAHIGYWEHDLSRNRVSLSAEAAGIYGVTPSEPTEGVSLWLKRRLECVHPEDRARVSQFMAGLPGTPPKFDLEYRVETKDGGTRILRTVGEVTADRDGAPTRVFGTVQDVTELRKAEDKARRLAAIVVSSDDAIIGKTLGGIIESWNRGAERIYGYSEQEALGRPISMLVPEGSEAEIADILAMVSAGKHVDHYEAWRRRKDGRLIRVSLMVSPVRDAKGEIVGASTICRDITERMEAERRISDSEERLRLTLEAGKIGIWDWDVQNGVWHASPTYFTMLGYEPTSDAVDNAEWLDRVHVDDRALVAQKTEAVLNDAFEDYRYEVRIRNADGVYRWMSVEGFGVEKDSDDRVTRMLGTRMDVTERKRNECINAARLHLIHFSAGHSLDELLEETLNETEKLTDSLIGFYHFVDDNQESLTLQNWSTRTKAEFCNAEGKGSHYAISEAGVWVECVGRRGPVVHNDYASLPNRKGMPEGHAAVVRELVVPVLRGGRVVAILGIGNKPCDYDHDDVKVSSLMADLAWEIADRKRAQEALQRLNRELRAISICNQTLLRAADEQALLDEICSIVCKEAGYRLVWVGYAQDDKAKTVRPVAWAGMDDGYLAGAGITWSDTRHGRGPTGTAIRTGEPATFEDFATDPDAEPWRKTALPRGYRSSVSLPLKDHLQETFGALTIYSKEADNFTADEVRLLSELAADLAFGITVIRSRAELARAEAALQQSEEKYRAVAEFTFDWETWIGPKGEFIYVSPSCERITGYKAEEFSADPELFTRIVHPEDRSLVEKHMAQAARGQVTYRMLEYRITARDGELRWVEHVCQSVYDSDGQWSGQRASNRDVTDRKRAEEQVLRLNQELEQRVLDRTAQLEAANRELESFSYSISHDLRAPLRVIDGFARILQEDYFSVFDEEGRKLCASIADNAMRMAKLIEGLLVFSRLGKAALQQRVVDMQGLVAAVVQELGSPDSIQSPRFVVKDLPQCLGDETLLRQVWANLVGNAVKFSSKKSDAVIEIGAASAEGVCTYYVRDNGAGFDPAYADKLFGVFQRLHSAEEFEGTGIGLANVRRIVARHGGRTWADGRLGGGATFYFALPAPPA